MRYNISEQMLLESIFNNGVVNIYKNNNELYFEIENFVTNDISEAVSIMMRVIDYNNPIWKMEINKDSGVITPHKTLYWLSGGDVEWKSMKNYKYAWDMCYELFEEEYGFIVKTAVRKAIYLKDIRDFLIKHLNLPTLYDFAISRGLTR